MFYPNKRCEYLCEILDGGSGPLFRVTSMEDKDHPITNNASSGAWIEIYTKINEITGMRKGKVTVSGPDRFGLSEVAVTQLLASLPDAEKCAKFKPPLPDHTRGRFSSGPAP